MYKRVRIRNFRGLRDLTIDDLGRVNLIVGENGAGKTSLLEALYLFRGAGSPALTFPLATSRGFQFMPQSAELVWHLLFPEASTDQQIRIEASGWDGTESALEITSSREPIEQFLTNGGHIDGAGIGRAIDPAIGTTETLLYEFWTSDGRVLSSKATLRQGQPVLQTTLEANSPVVFLPTEHQTDGEVLAAWFTQLQDSGELETLVLALRALEPKLTRLSLGYSMPERQPVIRGHIEQGRPLPLPILGGGISRLAKMLLAIVSAGKGLALIDEVDTGLYHRHLEDAWRALDVASLDTNVQLVATTHSWECIEAALAAFGDVQHAADFRLHRLERTASGHRLVTYTHETAQAAFDINVEVR